MRYLRAVRYTSGPAGEFWTNQPSALAPWLPFVIPYDGGLRIARVLARDAAHVAGLSELHREVLSTRLSYGGKIKSRGDPRACEDPPVRDSFTES